MPPIRNRDRVNPFSPILPLLTLGFGFPNDEVKILQIISFPYFTYQELEPEFDRPEQTYFDFLVKRLILLSNTYDVHLFFGLKMGTFAKCQVPNFGYQKRVLSVHKTKKGDHFFTPT